MTDSSAHSAVRPDELLQATSARARKEPILLAMLEAMPGVAVVLNAQRQIVLANARALQAFGASGLDEVLGSKLGDSLGCVHAGTFPAGCGNNPTCGSCGATSTILRSLSQRTTEARECSLVVEQARGFVMEAEMVSSPIELDGMLFSVVSLRDISAEKRRSVLERVFFHDVLDTAGGLRSLAALLTEIDDPETEKHYKELLVDLADRLVDTIVDQRQLLAAEAGDLETNPTLMSVATVWRSVQGLYSRLDAAHNRKIVIASTPAIDIETDPKLLQRVLGNMVKNALEATPSGGSVTLSAVNEGDSVTFYVHNPGVMSTEVKQKIFQRSFSTKGKGRGLGTHSMRLLGERYLHGKVSFVSNEQEGTSFSFRISRRWPLPEQPLAVRSRSLPTVP